MNTEMSEKETILQGPYLTPLAVWALSFGCAVGWGSFVMPGTTFLPQAGPLGTLTGILLGALVMYVIGVNYHYLINKYPEEKGILGVMLRIFGYDHGFLSAWFLALVYVAIIWANASALGLISKNLLGTMFQFGFHYRILGYDVFLGEVLLSVLALLICGLVCIRGKKLAAGIQILFAFLLLSGILICFFAVLKGNFSDVRRLPPFAPGTFPLRQILTIVALSPWAFVGFESVTNYTGDFRFSLKKTEGIFLAALIAGAFSYIALVGMAAVAAPSEYDGWTAYIANLGGETGLRGLPTFYAAERAMGTVGVVILGIAALSGIVTGLIGDFIAAACLMKTMAEEGILPEWFCAENEEGSPKNAFRFLTLISLFIPLLGRTAIGWIVDVTTVGATVAYGYSSMAAYLSAKKEGNRKVRFTGLFGFCMALVFFFYFMAWSAGALSTESYLILAAWSILGFAYFRYVFAKDQKKRFGRSVVVWIGLLFLIFFTSLMWVRQATDDMTKTVVGNINEYYRELNTESDPQTVLRTEEYMQEQLLYVDHVLVRNSIIQMLLIIASLAIMFSIYMTMSRREKEMELEKARAQESDRAKTVFLSNMSHDIRTPMNAIIGYTNLAEQEGVSPEQMREYLKKIKGSSAHLLALINDVLEMSRIESGKMELELIAVDLKKTLNEVKDLFATQMAEKKIDFFVDTSHVQNPYVYCDKNRLNRILLNLVSNAYKFTPEGGTVSVTAREAACDSPGRARFELRVADSGIGMSEEFAAKVFEAFEREQNTTVSGIQGTGLGMSITKALVDMMDGEISVKTAKDRGTEFLICLELAKQEADEAPSAMEEESPAGEEFKISADFSAMRLLLAEDMEINREIAVMQLTALGFSVDTAQNGKEALERLLEAGPGYYNAILMDIQMPVMNGYEAAKAIRALSDEGLKKIPIIAMTANAFSEDVKRAMDAGMNAHIAKPIDVNVMTNVLRDVLG
ncbi:MAG: amino acid permease [Lachnospiraceae bacterium]|nr:amino acid permease [Lachnospiraceae bacterium]